MNVAEILAQQGLTLPAPPQPAANYTPAVQIDNLVFLSGQTPKIANEVQFQGKVGRELSVTEGYQAAQLCTLRLVSALQECVGDLSNVKKIVKLTIFVNATDDFTSHPKVADGASDLLEILFKDLGQHARAAVGVSSLPSGAAVEVELIAQV